ncbi:hypothetical protein GCM10022234_00750 [Aeromicrobium panaciterrae]|uniref:hypothetical protein n=1 Tax=Aeromicrobium panaciterrae TaxID=363861 RepID=UPI0031E46FC8
MSTVVQPADYDAPRAEFEKQLGFTRLDFNDTDEWEKRVVAQAIKHIAANNLVFTTDQVRPLLPEVHPNRIGAGFAAASARGEIVHVGYTKSKKVSSHGRVVGMWRSTTSPRHGVIRTPGRVDPLPS